MENYSNIIDQNDSEKFMIIDEMMGLLDCLEELLNNPGIRVSIKIRNIKLWVMLMPQNLQKILEL